MGEAQPTKAVKAIDVMETVDEDKSVEEMGNEVMVNKRVLRLRRDIRKEIRRNNIYLIACSNSHFS